MRTLLLASLLIAPAFGQFTGTTTPIIQWTGVGLLPNDRVEFQYSIANVIKTHQAYPTNFTFTLIGGQPNAQPAPLPGSSGQYYASDSFRVSVYLGTSRSTQFAPSDVNIARLNEDAGYAALVPASFDNIPAALFEVTFSLTAAQVKAAGTGLSAINVIVEAPLTPNGEGWSIGNLTNNNTLSQYATLDCSNATGTWSQAAQAMEIYYVSPEWIALPASTLDLHAEPEHGPTLPPEGCWYCPLWCVPIPCPEAAKP